MIKRIVTGFLIMILCLLGGVPVFGQPATYYIYDDTGILRESEMAKLDVLAVGILEKYGIAPVFILSESCNDKETADYAQACYEEAKWSEDTVLLVINEGKDEYFFYTTGRAEDFFKQKDLDRLWMVYDQEEHDYDGVEAYLNATEAILGERNAPFAAIGSAAVKNPSIPAERQKERLVDEAGLLTADEGSDLLEKLNEMSERQHCDVAIVTVPSLSGKTSTAFADDFYDYNGYGAGPARDGILFLISMEDRDWAISTHGYGISAFTDAGQAYIMDQVRPHLSQGDFAASFHTFADLSDEFLTQARSGKPYGEGNLPKGSVSHFWIFGDLGIGALLSFLTLKGIKSSLKSVSLRSNADPYVHGGRVNLTHSQDTYLSSHVSRTAKPKESQSSSGGSSTHTSSSGSTHGGSSGKF